MHVKKKMKPENQTSMNGIRLKKCCLVSRVVHLKHFFCLFMGFLFCLICTGWQGAWSLSQGTRGKGRGHTGWDGNPSQGTITLTHYGLFRHVCQPTTHVCGLGRKPEYLEETPETHREHVYTAHAGRTATEPLTLEL